MARPLPRIVSAPMPADAPRGGSFWRGLVIQLNVIGSLVLRELHTRYGRQNIGYLWLIMEPMLLAVMIAILHARFGTHPSSDILPVPLALLGYCHFMIFRNIFNRAEGALEANLPLLYHRRVTISDLLMARALLEAVGAFLSMVILIGLAVAVGLAEMPVRPLFVLLGTLLMVLLSWGLSMIVCSLTYHNRTSGRFVHPMSYILLPLSGTFSPMQWLPDNYSNVMLYIPLAHIFEILRYGWFYSAVPSYIDARYLSYWILGSILLGLLGLRAVRRKVDMS